MLSADPEVSRSSCHSEMTKCSTLSPQTVDAILRSENDRGKQTEDGEMQVVFTARREETDMELNVSAAAAAAAEKSQTRCSNDCFQSQFF